jgi:uncharacterized protein (UPF0332 family)
LTDESKALVRYRMERAIEALDEAKVMFDSGHINTYVNRLYYACFYAVSALLLSHEESTGKLNAAFGRIQTRNSNIEIRNKFK